MTGVLALLWIGYGTGLLVGRGHPSHPVGWTYLGLGIACGIWYVARLAR